MERVTGAFGINRGPIQALWNPLTDDGDALRLAVKLGIFDRKPLFQHFRAVEGMNGFGIEEATRRAIVRAAAEIGRKA